MLRWLMAAILAFAILGFEAGPSQAAQFQVKTTQDFSRLLIVLNGKIVHGDLGRLKIALRDVDRQTRRLRFAEPPLLSLMSTGGSLEEGLAMGRLLKRQGIATTVLPNDYCASACTFIFFGGFDSRTKAPARTAYHSSWIGVHRWGAPTFRTKIRFPPGALKELDDHMRRQVETYFREMGIVGEISRRTFETPNDRIYRLNAVDMVQAGIDVRPLTGVPAPAALPSAVFPCNLRCLLGLNMHPMKPAAVSLWQALPDRPLSGAAFLQTWTTLPSRQVEIAACTIWRPDPEGASCIVRDQGRTLGSIRIQASRPPSPIWPRIAQMCATAEPAETCRVSLSGTVRVTPDGPVIYRARAGGATESATQ